MTNIPSADADNAAIHAAFAKPVRYTGAGLSNASIGAVKSDVPADGFHGAGATARQLTFQVLQSALPSDPAKDDRITDDDGAGVEYAVIDITPRNDVDAWDLIVERAV